ncbi:hypothetical protein JQ038_14700 [Clostridium botulinum]|nr:hypothetical protein [Clostridium botulinum]
MTGISVRTLHYYNNKWKYGSDSSKFIQEALKFYSEIVIHELNNILDFIKRDGP